MNPMGKGYVCMLPAIPLSLVSEVSKSLPGVTSSSVQEFKVSGLGV